MGEEFEAPLSFNSAQPADTSIRLFEDAQSPEPQRAIGFEPGAGGGASWPGQLSPLEEHETDRLNALNAAKHLKNLIPNGEDGISRDDIEKKLMDRSLSCNEIRALQWMHEKYSELKTSWQKGWYYNLAHSQITPESFKKYGTKFIFPKS
jgi:hypothetical protein